jgi:hypothetical protein
MINWVKYDLNNPPEGHMMDYGGLIEGYSLGSIMIAGSRFFRERFKFRAYIK